MQATSSPLISVAALQAALASTRPPVVADCRFVLSDPAAGEARYRAGHVPGANYLHLDRDLAAPRGATGGRHPLPGAAAFAATMRRIGLDIGAPLVAYDDAGGAFAARLWWLARYYGHDDVRVLDGGIAAWIAAGHALQVEVPALRDGNFTARELPALALDYDAVRRERDAGRVTLVDARDPRRFQGLEEPLDPKAGHIPGALNRPWTDAVGADGRFLPAAAQAARWQGAGDGAQIVAYCGSGVTACANLLSLELAGIHGARLYAGSWSDWCLRPDAEIATGE